MKMQIFLYFLLLIVIGKDCRFAFRKIDIENNKNITFYSLIPSNQQNALNLTASWDLFFPKLLTPWHGGVAIKNSISWSKYLYISSFTFLSLISPTIIFLFSTA